MGRLAHVLGNFNPLLSTGMIARFRLQHGDFSVIPGTFSTVDIT